MNGVTQCVYYISMSVQGWEFPVSWKASRITPVYKRMDSVTDPRFYRLIAVLSTLSIFEKAFYSQLY